MKFQNFKFNKRVESILVIGLIVLIGLMLVYLLARPIFTEDKPADTAPVATDTIKLLPLDNEKTLSVDGEDVILPNGWTATSYYQNAESANLKCSIGAQNDCRIYVVTNGTNTFYISNPSDAVYDSSFATTPDNRPIIIAGKTVTFSYDTINQIKRDSDAETATTTDISDPTLTIYDQLHGCIDTKVCISSGILSSVLENNKKDVAAFETFARLLKF